MNYTLHMNDSVEVKKDIADIDLGVKNRLSAGPKKTKITLIDHNTGEILDTCENKVVITGSQMNAMKMFGLEYTVKFPNYNTEMALDNSVDPSETPKNSPLVCLFCVSDSGCGTLPKDIYISKYTDRIKPAPKDPASTSEFTSEMIMPFRYVDVNNDISDDLRKYYFGRKTFNTLGKIGYYFKSFDTDPVLHLRYADGTQITDNIYNNESTQTAECYIETRLRVTRLDFRDYFENALGWDNARISSLSLCFAWYDDTIDDYVYYQDITPYTILNFSFQSLASADTSIDVVYQIYY